MITREDIVRRFEEWLDASLAEEAPLQGIPNEILTGEEGDAENSPTDLHAMWSAVTTLTQEVKLQSRGFKQLSETLASERERKSRKEVLDSLLEMRERLLRGLQSVSATEKLQPGLLDRIAPSRWRAVEHALEVSEALEEGYRSSLRSLDDLLEAFQVRPIACEGKPFDPRSMRAVDTQETSKVSQGTVLSVYRNGYEWNGEVYRPADVRVARSPSGNGNGNESSGGESQKRLGMKTKP